MEPRLKELIKRLVHAIDESLSDSESIAEVIGEIKKEGYDALLVLEATIGFSKQSQKGGAEKSTELTHKDLDANLTLQDQEFLKALSITLEA